MFDSFGAGGQCRNCVGDEILNSSPKSRGAKDALEERTGKQNHLKERNSCNKHSILKMQKIVLKTQQVSSKQIFSYCTISAILLRVPALLHRHPLILLTTQDFGGFLHLSVLNGMGNKSPIYSFIIYCFPSCIAYNICIQSCKHCVCGEWGIEKAVSASLLLQATPRIKTSMAVHHFSLSSSCFRGHRICLSCRKQILYTALFSVLALAKTEHKQLLVSWNNFGKSSIAKERGNFLFLLQKKAKLM